MGTVNQKDHYDGDDPQGRSQDLEGAGPLALITYDQLHPPMVDDEAVWADGDRWYEGAVRHTLEAAELAGIRQGDKILDIGCGVGGPARTLVDEFGATVYAVSTSETQLATFRRFNQKKREWSENIRVELHDCQVPYLEKGFDLAWSLNMFYHVESKPAMLRAAWDALRPGGRLMIDDWMLTPRATEEDRALMTYQFLSPHFAVREEMPELLESNGFRLLRFQDLGHVGRLYLQKWFGPVFEETFRPLLLREPLYGKETADHFAAAIELSARMYRDEKLTYFRFAAVKV